MGEEAGSGEKPVTTGEPASIHIQVCYALPEQQFLRDLQVPAGTTLRDALLQSDLLGHLGGGKLENHKLGIYGKIKPPETLLRDHDRVEIYRALQADPKDARRRRVEKKKSGNS